MLAETPLADARARARAVRPPAAALVATSALSSQFGAAIATRLFPEVGPAGTLTLRLVFAAIALLAVARPRPGALRRARRADLAVVVGFGLALAAMNLSFYEAVDRVPLGVAVTLEFAGPLTLSVVTSRRWAHVLWALMAGAGVVLLAGGGLLGAVHRLDLGGVGFALLAGAFWALYILANKSTGRRFPGASGLAWAMVVAAAAVAPVGAAEAGARLLRPGVLGVGIAVAVLSSALPYSCEMAALRRVTPRAFGILLSMAPALAALAGLVVLGQHLSPLEMAALVLVVAANVGSSWAATPRPMPSSPVGVVDLGHRPADRRPDRDARGEGPLHVLDVADDADHPAPVLESPQHVDDGVERLGVERPEPLVHEEGADVAVRAARHDVGEAEGERQGAHERLAARERRRGPDLAGVHVEGREVEPPGLPPVRDAVAQL